MSRTTRWSFPAALLTGVGLTLGLVAIASGQVPPPGDEARAVERQKSVQKTEDPAKEESKAPAEEPEAPLLNPDRADDEKAIRGIVAAFVKAFNAGDIDALMASFEDESQVVDETGATFKGKDAIRGRFAEAFQTNPGGAISIEIRTLDFYGPDTAIERGSVTFQRADNESQPESNPYTVLYVRRKGKWTQATVEDHAQPGEPAEGSNGARLVGLEWLVGDWINESTDSVVYTSTRWDDAKNYLLMDYTIKAQGKPVLKGTQRIGWDPVRKQVRSWSFDDDGGFGEGYWSVDDEGRWVVRATGTRRDGKVAESTRIVTPLDAHRIQWQSVNRSMNGVARPDIDAFVMVRKPPEPSAAQPKAAAPEATPKPR